MRKLLKVYRVGVGKTGRPRWPRMGGLRALIQRQESEPVGADNPRGANQALLRDVGVAVEEKLGLAAGQIIRETHKPNVDTARLSVVDCPR